MTAGKALELALLYSFVTELTSLIVVADDNFTLDDGPDGNRALEDAAVFGLPTPNSGPDIAAVRKSNSIYIVAVGLIFKSRPMSYIWLFLEVSKSIVIFSFLPFVSPSAESSSLGVALSAHSINGVIAGSVIIILFVLGGIATVTSINLAICFYIAGKKRRNPAPRVATENRPILLSSVDDEVDKPSDTLSPASTEKIGEEMKTEAAMEKEREAMEEEGEQRYQPQEAIFVTPSAVDPRDTEGDIKN